MQGHINDKKVSSGPRATLDSLRHTVTNQHDRIDFRFEEAQFQSLRGAESKVNEDALTVSRGPRKWEYAGI
jgi:hypothetical protein